MRNNIYIFMIILILIIYYLVSKCGEKVEKQTKDKFNTTIKPDTMEVRDFIESKTNEFDSTYLDNLKKCNSSIETSTFEKDNIKIQQYKTKIDDKKNEIYTINSNIQQYRYQIEINSDNKEEYEFLISKEEEKKNVILEEINKIEIDLRKEDLGKFVFIKMKDTEDCKFKTNEKKLSDKINVFNTKLDSMIKDYSSDEHSLTTLFSNSQTNFEEYKKKIEKQDHQLYKNIENVYGLVADKFLKVNQLFNNNFSTHENFGDTCKKSYTDEDNYFKKYLVLPYQYKYFNHIYFEIKKEVVVDYEKLDLFLNYKLEKAQYSSENTIDIQSRITQIKKELEKMNQEILNIKINQNKNITISDKINKLNSVYLKEYFNKDYENSKISTRNNIKNIDLNYVIEVRFNPKVNKKYSIHMNIDNLINHIEKLSFVINIIKDNQKTQITSKIMDLLNKEVIVKKIKELKTNIINIISKSYGNGNLYNEITVELETFVKTMKSIKKELMNENINKYNLNINYDDIFNKILNGIKFEMIQYLFKDHNHKKILHTDNVRISLVNNPKENNNIFLIKYLISTPSFNENYDNDNSSIINGFKFTILKTIKSNIYAEKHIVTKDMYSILDEIGFKSDFTFILYLTNCNYDKTYNLNSGSVFNNKDEKYELLSEEQGQHLYTLYDKHGNQLLSMKNV